MKNSSIRLLTALFLVCVTALITGCAGMQSSGGPQVFDPQRMESAVGLDDVGYVRAAVEARTITVNQPIPAMGYEAIPLVALAARNGSINVLKYLISQGVNLNVRTPDHDTPLMLAAFFFEEGPGGSKVSVRKHEEAVRMLVDAGAELENWGNLYTPLGYAAYQGRDDTLRYLLSRGARVNADAQGRTININTPLMMAAIQGHANVARQLLMAGADAGIRVKGGHTAHELALKYNHTHMFQMLTCAERLQSGESFVQRCK
jgi:hypothetical protein